MIKVSKPAIHGSNEKGEYWKYPNGLLICRGIAEKIISTPIPTTGGYYDDGYGILLPHAFVDESYYCTASHAFNGRILWVYATRIADNASFWVDVFSPSERANYQTKIQWIAVGHWK